MARGRFAAADTALRRAEELSRGLGGAEWWPGSLCSIGMLRLWQGRLDEAAQMLEHALEAVDEPQYAP